MGFHHEVLMRYGIAGLLAFTLAACGQAAAPTETPVPGVPEVAPVAAPAATANGAVTGTVLETMNAASYTYMRLQTGTGEVWAAVPETTTAVGATVTVQNPMTMTAFTSPTLNKTFDTILFGTLGDGTAPAASAPAGTPAMGSPAAPADDGPISVAKATGADAHTIAEVWAQKDTLKNTPVTISGKVVKATNGVMGKNWLHLKDGTGAAAGPDNDITVTSADTAQLGDVVTVKGTVHTDMDFGGGYSYAVIIEEATVAK